MNNETLTLSVIADREHETFCGKKASAKCEESSLSIPCGIKELHDLTELSDEERINVIAYEVFERYKPAFIELAKW